MPTVAPGASASGLQTDVGRLAAGTPMSDLKVIMPNGTVELMEVVRISDDGEITFKQKDHPRGICSPGALLQQMQCCLAGPDFWLNQGPGHDQPQGTPRPSQELL